MQRLDRLTVESIADNRSLALLAFRLGASDLVIPLTSPGNSAVTLESAFGFLSDLAFGNGEAQTTLIRNSALANNICNFMSDTTVPLLVRVNATSLAVNLATHINGQGARPDVFITQFLPAFLHILNHEPIRGLR